MIGVDLNMKAIEFFKDPAQTEESQIFPQATAPGLKVQGLCSFWWSARVKVLGLTLLNIRPLLTFLERAETMLSRSKSTLKSILALSMISVTCRGFGAASSRS